MKILAFVDLHGDLKELKRILRRVKREKIDYLLCAGDITVFGSDLDFLLAELNTALCPVLVIHGNHEDEEEMEYVCSMFKNLNFIHNKTKRVGKVLFACHGGGGFSTKDIQFERAFNKLKRPVKKGDKVILMTHAPPAVTEIDYIYEEHVGSRPIKRFIREVRPVLAISGHIHETEGIVQKLGKTIIANPGPKGMVWEV